MPVRMLCTVLISAFLIAAAPASPAQEPVTVSIPAGQLSGTLMLPADMSRPVPVALIIAGSGPTDRDGNQSAFLKTDAYKKLAQGLAARGIATLRYDKRGIGESTDAQAESDLRFDDFVNDALALAKKLEADKRFSSVWIIGHSEGSLIGTVAAERDSHVAGLVSLEGPGRDLGTIIDEQVSANPANPPGIVDEVKKIDASLKAGKTVANPDPRLAALFRPQIQAYLISEYAYDPKVEIAKLSIPVLIVHGSHDLQVSSVDAAALSAGDPRATMLNVDGMNHVLVDAPAARAANLATYGEPSLPLDSKLVPAVAHFIVSKGAALE
jgi:alpha-beta hydrolase superfamily lysophospholipase